MNDGLKQLNQAIDFLQEQNAPDETFKLLAAIAYCPFLDESLDKEFKNLGYKAATELFRGSNIYHMGEPEEIVTHPDNPENWKLQQTQNQSISYRGYIIQAKGKYESGFYCEVFEDNANNTHQADLDVTEPCKLEFVAIEIAKQKIDQHLIDSI